MDYEGRTYIFAVVDNDHGTYAQQHFEITSSGIFNWTFIRLPIKDALHEIENDEADIILQIPPRLKRTQVKEQSSALFMAVNAINGTKAGWALLPANDCWRNFNHDKTEAAAAGADQRCNQY